MDVILEEQGGDIRGIQGSYKKDSKKVGTLAGPSDLIMELSLKTHNSWTIAQRMRFHIISVLQGPHNKTV